MGTSVAVYTQVPPRMLATPHVETDAFVSRLFDSDAGIEWTLIGLAAQAVVAIALLRYWRQATAGPPRPPSAALAYLAACAAAVLMVYAIVERSLVFAIGQLLGVLIFWRIATAIGARRRAHATGTQRSFPVVAPDSAERPTVSSDGDSDVNSDGDS